jgi:hypothetical protein
MSKLLIIKEIVDFDMSFYFISVFTITPSNYSSMVLEIKKAEITMEK